MKTMISALQGNLENHLNSHLPEHSYREVCQYSVLPPGKLFRPLLAVSTYLDAKGEDEKVLNGSLSIEKLASSLEIHHAYTLVHDDLPCMDDDDMRRGKPSVHKQFGQWKAVLAGDALLNVSYQLLAKLDCPLAEEIRTFYSWALGPKGLILGQVMDLSNEMTLNFENLIRTHQLKTARLIQTSLLGGFLASQSAYTLEVKREAYQFFKLGDRLGVLFQMLDDLTELTEELNAHEQTVNPWLNFKDESFELTEKYLRDVERFVEGGKYPQLNNVIIHYFGKIKGLLEEGQSMVIKHVSKDEVLLPVMSLLNGVCKR